METKKCLYCDKEIQGYTEKQVNYMMMQHMLSKHQNKIVWRDLDGKIIDNKKMEEKKK